MKEGISNSVTLPEKFILLDKLFRLMYGFEIKGNQALFMELSIAAKKYLMMGILRACLNKLGEFLNVSNAVHLLLFACENEFDEFQNKSVQLIFE